jgi:multidrug efflux pump subunit AcrA (membrane-fusion protein)
VAQAQQQLTNARQTQGLDAQQQANAVAAAQKQVDADQATVNQAQATASANPNNAQDANALNSAQAQLTKDQQALTQAQNQQQSTALKDQQQVSSAQVSLNSAANSQANSATGNTTTAQIALQTAQKNLADCVVKAPSDGTVTAIGAVVGATAGSGSGATSSSSSSSGGTGGTGAAAASSGNSSSSSSSGLVTLTDTAHLQVVAGFSESDVATMKVGQTATFTFPAIKADANAAPVTGSVTAIAATSTTTSGVVTYAVTVSMANPPAAVRLGESANISVTTATADNALIVPSLAITTAGNRQTVTVERNGAEQTVAVTTGITANGRTQVLTGLNDGDQVVLPSVTTSTDTGTSGTQGGRGIFGGGGGGFGGGGTGGNANTGTGR